ncbi:Acyl-CoA dehydrogenase, N-terminal domain [Bordetella trematum]|nr:Acyl-CoA dehydrogenase, N-terminal domain [Bordetella trematum]
MSEQQAKPEPSMRTPFRLSAETGAWFEVQAEDLDRGELGGPPVLARLAEAQVFGLGVAPEWGGAPGTDIGHAIEAIADLARHSLTAAFLAWGQRVVIETLLRSGNASLARRWVPELMAARLAGASGLSNVIKSLGGFDRLRIHAREDAGAGDLTVASIGSPTPSRTPLWRRRPPPCHRGAWRWLLCIMACLACSARRICRCWGCAAAQPPRSICRMSGWLRIRCCRRTPGRFCPACVPIGRAAVRSVFGAGTGCAGCGAARGVGGQGLAAALR